MKIVAKPSSNGDRISLQLTPEEEAALARTCALATELRAIPGMTVKFQIMIELAPLSVSPENTEVETEHFLED